MIRVPCVRVLLVGAWLGACAGGEVPSTQSPTPVGAVSVEPPENVDVRIPTARYAWDPKAGDPTVSADLGGPGFTGDGWSTRIESYALGNPDAPQGGAMTLDLQDWPPTLRQAGPQWQTSFNYFAEPLLYMSLVDLDPVTLEFVPSLATHWWISPDGRTFRFRINPEAKWSDGNPVTADDVVATYKLRMDPALAEPATTLIYGRLLPPVALSKYVVEVQVLDEHWGNFLYFATSSILPSREIGALTGAQYADRYEFAYTAVTGPYQVLPQDIESGTAITLSRRRDWWGEKNPLWDGWFNIDRFRFVVIKDAQLRFEKIKRGEIDYLFVQKAQWWTEDIPALDAVVRGLLVPRKFFTEAPVGLSGLAVNLTRPPLDDLRVRQALDLLFDRRGIVDELFYGEYEPMTSYHPGGIYASPDLQPVPYDPQAAIVLLEEAGWIEKNAEGYRVREGKELALTVTYSSQLSEHWLALFADACQKAGIRLDLQLLAPPTAMENVRDREFQLFDATWAGLRFPNPEASWHSRYAAMPGGNNVTGMADARMDGLCNRYGRADDLQQRIGIAREIDTFLRAEVPYLLGWYNPAQRVLFWNKFGMPDWGTARAYRAEYDNMFVLWWVDPEKEQQLEAARTDPSATMDPGRREVRFWKSWSAKHANASVGAAP